MRPTQGLCTRAQNVGDGLVRQEPVHTVAAQEKAVVPCHLMRRIVQPQLRLHAERAGKDARPAGAILPHVVAGQAGEAIAA